jgi:PAS domain S-box-containing protein
VFLDRTVIFIEDGSINFLIIFGIITLLNAFLLVWGTHEFIGRKMTLGSLYAAIVVGIASGIIVSLNPAFELKSFLVAMYFGIMCIWTGIIFLRKSNIAGFGVWLTGLSLILLGLHGIDFIFMRPVVWFVPWGYLIDALLRFLIALGTLIVYLEKTRTDLIHSRDCYRLLAENAVDIIYRYRLVPVPGFEYVSPSIATITGYSADAFYTDAQLIVNIVHPDDRQDFEAFLQTPSASMSPLTLRLIPKVQKSVWVEQTSVPVYGEDGKIRAVEGVIRDITMRRQLEQDMARLDSLNTIGEMAANLAHEVRNPMTTVRGYLQMLSQNPELTRYEERFGIMIEELDRTNSIISEYLSFCKNKVVEFKLCYLDKIVLSLFPLLQADANACSTQVELALNEIPPTSLDEKEIRQLILNLVRNGLEAMPASGTLTIRTYLEDDEVILAIQDQGTGIPQEILERLGTPFMTTKDTGTGLGLAVCYRIVNRHQAKLKVETSSEGTTFFVHFTPQIIGE